MLCPESAVFGRSLLPASLAGHGRYNMLVEIVVVVPTQLVRSLAVLALENGGEVTTVLIQDLLDLQGCIPSKYGFGSSQGSSTDP
ncbi:MAG: hypothetical protein JWR10_439 [Rubritepida sp.]|nr:hypothetical protein [Rubritepida sp.]